MIVEPPPGASRVKKLVRKLDNMFNYVVAS